MKDLLTRLENGESADAIAKEFTDALNKAEAEYQKAQKEGTLKRVCMKDVLDDIIEYLSTFYSDNKKIAAFVDKYEGSDEDVDKAIAVIDDCVDILSHGIKLKTFGFDMFSPFLNIF